jgi:hypothetical protein
MLSTSVDGHNEYINAVFLPVSWLCRMKHFYGIPYQYPIPTGKYDVPYAKTHTSPVDRWFESRSGKLKDNTNGVCCLFSPSFSCKFAHLALNNNHPPTHCISRYVLAFHRQRK